MLSGEGCGLTEEAKANLQSNTLGQILLRMGHLLGKMRDGIRSTNGEGSVENTEEEGQTRWVAGGIVYTQRVPDKVIGGVLPRHCCEDDDGDDASNNHEEHAEVLCPWYSPVCKDDKQG